MNADSVKVRLKNLAIKSGHLFQDELVAYCLERTIYRISISKYKENFTLKGGIFLYAVFDGTYSRITRDIDFLANSIGNDINTMKIVFQDVFAIASDDAVEYDLNTLQIQTITEFKEYPGINISIIALLDRTKIPVSIDIGYGDIIYPNRVIMDFPVLLNMDVPRIYAYSLSSVIAEKFEAMVSLGYANSRYKDFYDVYILCCEFSFDGKELSRAIKETFLHRGTKFEDIVVFDPQFYKDESRKTRWNSFVNKKRAMLHVDFEDVGDLLICFLEPIISKLKENQLLEKKWNGSEKNWIILNFTKIRYDIK